MKTSYDASCLLYTPTLPLRAWHMSNAERSAVLHVLQIAQPDSALEVGTAQGGCLQQIRRFAKKTYSIDLSPEVRDLLTTEMPDVDFLTGDSKQLIGRVLAFSQERSQPLGFALIDGDHSYAGVRADLAALLTYRPPRPLWVLMHDSTNPDCRAGIASAPWGDNPHVHMVDLDFVNGAISEDPRFENMLWGGLDIALLLPEPRHHALTIAASGARTYAALFRASRHNPSLLNWAQNWIAIKRRGLARRLNRSR